MASAEEYASWIVENKDKQGTPEFDKVSQAYRIARGATKPSEKKSKTSPLMAIPAGINTLIPGVLGMPVDTATNLANLGIAGYGAVKGALGSKAEDLPEPLKPQFGGSQSIAEGISKLLGADVFSNPRPDSKLAQMLHTGSAVAAGGLLSPATGIKQAVGNVGRMLPAAGGAAIAQQIAPDSPLAPIIGAMVPSAISAAKSAISGRSAANTQNAIKEKTFREGVKSGFVAPPSEVKPTLMNSILESISGKAGTRQGASLKNQPVVDSKIKAELGIPDDVVVTEQTLKNIRKEAGTHYEAVKNVGPLKTDKQYISDLAGIDKKFSGASKDFPGLSKPDVLALTSALRKKVISSEGAVEQIKALRDSASEAYRKGDYGIAGARKAAAKTLEDLIERNIQFPTIAKRDPAGAAKLLKDYREARTLIAKVHDAEDAFNKATGSFEAKHFAKLLDKNKPLTGGFREVGEFAKAFPRAMQAPEMAGNPNISKLQATLSGLLGAGGGFATGGPGVSMGALPFVLPPAARKFLLSKSYQNSLVPESVARPQSPQAALLASILMSQPQDMER